MQQERRRATGGGSRASSGTGPETCTTPTTGRSSTRTNRDSGLIDLSNGDAIAKALTPFSEADDPDVVFESHSHWAVGHVDGFSIRVFRDGGITDAFQTYHEIAERLTDYPILDEEDYGEREYVATVENIADAAWRLKNEYDLPEGWEGDGVLLALGSPPAGGREPGRPGRLPRGGRPAGRLRGPRIRADRGLTAADTGSGGKEAPAMPIYLTGFTDDHTDRWKYYHDDLLPLGMIVQPKTHREGHLRRAGLYRWVAIDNGRFTEAGRRLFCPQEYTPDDPGRARTGGRQPPLRHRPRRSLRLARPRSSSPAPGSAGFVAWAAPPPSSPKRG